MTVFDLAKVTCPLCREELARLAQLERDEPPHLTISRLRAVVQEKAAQVEQSDKAFRDAEAERLRLVGELQAARNTIENLKREWDYSDD